MVDEATPLNKPDEETRAAAEPVEEELEEALEDIDTPQKAAAVAEELVEDAGTERALEAAQDAPRPEGTSPQEQADVAAQAVEEAAEEAAGDVERAAAVIEATAAEAVALEGPAYEAMAGAVQEASRPMPEDERECLKRGRRLLRDALLQHPSVGLLQAYDTELFVFINNSTPRTPLIDAFFHQISVWFTGGWAWVLGFALRRPFQTEWLSVTLRLVGLPIWIPTLLVEGPIKMYFRRRRPYIDIVRAVVVGKKPGNWSFPSGHSAAAFAGARMLGQYAPGWRSVWYSLAGLVAFSRVYVGAHYPGDVVSGSLFGFVFAEATRWLLKQVGLGGR
jgi:undecaprenyl-diphosphatase